MACLRGEALSLFRSFLRTAASFRDYNIREYARRRAVDGFRRNQALSDPSSIAAAFSEGKTQLGVARRQALVYQLYPPMSKSVMEIVVDSSPPPPTTTSSSVIKH